MSPISGGMVSGLILLLVSAFSVYGHWHHHEVKSERPEDVQRDAPESVTDSTSQEPTKPPRRTCGHRVNCAFQLYKGPDPFNFVPTEYIKSPCGDCIDGYECKWFMVAEQNEMVVYKCQEIEEATTVSESVTAETNTDAKSTAETDTEAESTTAAVASTTDQFYSYFEGNNSDLVVGMVHVVLMRNRRESTPDSCRPLMPCGVQRLKNGTVEFIPYCPVCPDGYACTPFETEPNGWYRAYTCQQIETEAVTDHSEVQRRSGSMVDIHEL